MSWDVALVRDAAQLGLTFCDAEGRLPLIEGFYCAWQFNFREFNVHEDVYAQDSIELLRHSGIDFKAHSERGIDVHKFGELIMARRGHWVGRGDARAGRGGAHTLLCGQRRHRLAGWS